MLMLVANVLVSVYDFQEPYDFSLAEEVEFFKDAFILSFMHTGTILMAAVGIKFFKNFILNQERVNDLETTNLKTELAFLKNQINPHFLFNTLNSLYALTLKKSDKAPEIVVKLSEMMRYMLYESNDPKVPLQKEIKYIENILNYASFLNWLNSLNPGIYSFRKPNSLTTILKT